MPAGVATSPETEAEFRAHYLYSGNAAESARAVGLPERTGREIAKRLNAEESFAADRRALRARALDELVSMRMRVARKAVERFESDAFIDEPGAIDKRPDYGKLVVEAEKAAHNLAKLSGGEDDAPPTRVEVTIKPSARAGADDAEDD